MTHGIGLRRFALAIVEGAAQRIGGWSAQAVAGIPEIGRARLISNVSQHAGDFALFDFPEGLAAELEIVTLLVDRKTAVAVDENAIVHLGDEFIERNIFL